MRRPRHWADVYRTDPLIIYETEAPIFDNPDLTSQELGVVEAVADRLGTRLASPVLDLACGPGRHALALAARGLAVTGVDHSEGLLEIATRGAATLHAGSRPRLVCADIRDLPFAERSFSSALLLGKSFGYFSDEQNLDLLRQIRARLRPGGLTCLELPDREPYLASMPGVETVERPRLDNGRETGETLRSEFRCHWHAEAQRLVVRETHVIAESGRCLWEGSWDVRLYSADEIVELARAAGFREVLASEIRLLDAPGAKSDVLIVGAIR